jgi:hypothetical protein
VKRSTALIPFVKLFLAVLLACLGFQAGAGAGRAAAIPQQSAPQLPLQCSNTVFNQYCDIRVVLLIDDTGSMRYNDPAFMRNQAAKNLVDILAQEYYQVAVDAQAVDPGVVLPDIKVAVIHFSHCISNNPLDHCSSDVKYNSGWMPIAQKDGLYTAIDWLKTQPDYYRVSQYTHFIEPFQVASDLFNDPAASSNNSCIHRMMVLLTDGTPEDIRGPLTEPDLGNEMGQVKTDLQGFLSQPENSLFVTAFKIVSKYWQATQPYWQDIAGTPEHVSLESSLDGVASRMEKIVTSIIGAVSNTIPPDPSDARLYKVEVLHHASSLRLTYYKLDPSASLALTDPQGNPVAPDGAAVTQTGKGTAIEVWTLSDPSAGIYQVRTSSKEGIITTILRYAVSAQLEAPTADEPLLQFTQGQVRLSLLDGQGAPVLPTDDPADVLNVEARVTNASQSLPLSLSLNGDQYQAGWMPLTAEAAQLRISLELKDAKYNSLWKCSGDTGDLPVDPVSVKAEPPAACTPVNTTLTVPLQVLNGRTGQNTGIGLPLQWQVASVTQPGGRAVDSSVQEVDAQTGEYRLTLKPVVPEDIRSHVTASVIADGVPVETWSYDANIPITVCRLPTPTPTPVPGNSCSPQWNYSFWALLILLLLLLLTRLILRNEDHKERKKFSLTFWILLILILLLILLWLLTCFNLSLWPLSILLLILLLILLRVRVLSGDDDHKSRRQEWILVILLVLLLMFWLIFFSSYWVYLALMLLVLLVTLLVIWLVSRHRDEDEPFPFWFLLILLALLVSLWLVFFGNFPGWLALILALIWLVMLLWLWLVYRDRNWRKSHQTWLLIYAFVFLVLIWLIYFSVYWIYLSGLLLLLLVLWVAGWTLYLYSNPLWGVIGIADRRNRLLWSASLADPKGSGGRSYYDWSFEEPVGTLKHLHIHSWDRRKHGLTLMATLVEGRRTFRRSLERWEDCELEDDFRIIWLEKAPEPKRPPQLKPRKPTPGGGRKARTRSYGIEEIEGIGPAYASRLRRLGIRTTEALLKVAGSRKGRQALAEKSGFSTAHILEWVNRADLMRVPGIGSEYSDLLEAGGVDTVKELRRRNAGNLYSTLRRVNQRKRLVRRLPDLEEVGAWIASARKMKAAVEY